ncbi:ATP-binding protein [Streptomyces sp. NPDC006134]|uniref:ATP-binding protein n=1 Tax=Streptomyces sp. NPDC006134 TaxID=3154467 RepID=UPI003404D4F2
MSGETGRVRLLPWAGALGQPCLLLTDGHGGTASRLADRIEDAQLGLADRLLGRARAALAQGRGGGEPGELTGQLADALADALLIAASRGARLGEARRGVTDGSAPLPSPAAVLHEVLAHDRAGTRGFALFALPGRDRASAPTARRHVRDTARAWSLPPATVDDLETITGELVANALEHSDSHTVSLACALTGEAAVVGVTDEGTAPLPVTSLRPDGPPGEERERGRGLLITEALATRWGTRRLDGGLTVWAEIALEPAGPAG